MADNNNNDKKKLDDNALAKVAGGVKWENGDICCENCGSTSIKILNAMRAKCTECGYIQPRIITNPQDLFNN